MAQRGKLGQWLRHSFSSLKRVFQGDLSIKGRVQRPSTEVNTQSPSGEEKPSPVVEEPTVPVPAPVQGISFVQNLFRKANADEVSDKVTVANAMPFAEISPAIPACREDFKMLSAPKEASSSKSPSTSNRDKTEAVAVSTVSSVDLLVDFFDSKYGTRTVEKDSMESAITTAIPRDPHPEGENKKANSDVWENERARRTAHADRRLQLKRIAQSKKICLSKGLPEKDELVQKTLDESGKSSKAGFSRSIYYKRLGPKQ
ncbi:uncharacterized protein LOC111071849 [Drosophila obscura]|uniref:uncharacterized protein LOC111071849 n=1 Tax=Drosophila obscura TaxID=7282 RepID=UPI001BB24AEF|nr:uncharacterized protein LOC111071849 [Drosophila obscura]